MSRTGLTRAIENPLLSHSYWDITTGGLPAQRVRWVRVDLNPVIERAAGRPLVPPL